MLYFAYGSNMHREQMRGRCPGALALGPARLAHHRFIISSDRYASIVPARGQDVHGILWRLTPRDLAALNAYEGVTQGLYRRAHRIVERESRIVRALVYIGRSARSGRAHPDYHNGIVIPAAREWGLPERYIRSLERWSQALR